MKTNLDNLFKTDKNVEKDGVWFNISDTIGFRVRRFSDTNPQIKKAMAMYYKPFARQMEMGTMDPEKEREIMVKLFVKACMMDWKGVEIDGKPAGYNEEVAIPFFMGLPDLFASLLMHSKDFTNFKIDEEGKEEVGNS